MSNKTKKTEAEQIASQIRSLNADQYVDLLKLMSDDLLEASSSEDDVFESAAVMLFSAARKLDERSGN